jgi:hypothetical protein
MLFKNSKKRFNCGDGNSLSKINNPCKFNVLDKSYNYSMNSGDNSGDNTVSFNTMSLKNNMTFCMIPKPRCSKCKK